MRIALSWFFGAFPPSSPQPVIVVLGLFLLATAVIGAMAMPRLWQEPD